MSRDGIESTNMVLSPYDDAMEALSSLITKRSRADKSNSGDRFDILFDYIKILELEEPIRQMKVIHVAGTKGKGSTCAFAESILRNCGFHTGLFTSPHLIDVRERFRLDGYILLFNCMSVRDPQLLLPRLINACARHGVHFKKALFVPNTSVYYKVGTALPAADAQVDLSWQLSLMLQRIWESLVVGEKGRDPKNTELTCEAGNDETEKGAQSSENSTVFMSLPLAINWLRDSVRKNQSVRIQVLVAGSLHLVGDAVQLIKK